MPIFLITNFTGVLGDEAYIEASSEDDARQRLTKELQKLDVDFNSESVWTCVAVPPPFVKLFFRD
jgi:hypothetical protein